MDYGLQAAGETAGRDSVIHGLVVVPDAATL
jgi:hypothetical protein